VLIARSPIEFPEKIKEGDHLVQFYENDNHLTETVANYVAPALMNGEGVFIIATRKHLEGFERELRSFSLNTSFLKLTNQLVMLDAHESLKMFMVNGIPDRDLFYKTVGQPINEMRALFSTVKAYGEIVNLLWDEENLKGTLALEALWSELLSKSGFTLLCAYPIDSLIEEKSGIAFTEICQCHTHVIPAEGVIEFDSQNEQLRKIAELQFKAGSENKTLNHWKVSTKEMLAPLTAIKLHLLELKDHLNESDMHMLVSKCEYQLERITNITKELSP
jgi:hypothetical protein